MTSTASFLSLSVDDDDDDEPLVTAAIPNPSVDDGAIPGFSMDDDSDPSAPAFPDDDDPLYPAFSKATRTAVIPTSSLF